MIIINNILKIVIFCFNFRLILIEKLSIKKKIKNFLNIIDISVIIPIFNSEKYLSLCLQSVINQSLNNIEIICIDDGSTDNSLKILSYFRNIDKRIRIIHQKNKGSGLARNLGIKKSKGKYIAFLDSDDLYLNKFILEFMVQKAIQNNVVICGGGIINFVQDKNNKIILLTNKKIYFKNENNSKYLDYQYDWFYQRFIYNKNFIKMNKLYFPNYSRYQDPPFFIKTMAIAKNFYSLKNITYFYRFSNKTKISDEKKLIDLYNGLKDCLDISNSFNLHKLYCRILSHLNDKIILNETKRFIKSKKLKFIIFKILNNINYKIIEKENFTFIKNSLYNEIKYF